MNKQSILFVASESLPYVKTGGLADVIGSLPKYLAQQNMQVSVILPLYRPIAINDHHHLTYVTTFNVDAGDIHTLANIYSEQRDGVTIYFVEHRDLFEREQLYGYADDAYRFGFFQHAVIRFIEEYELYPDIVHTRLAYRCDTVFNTCLLPLQPKITSHETCVHHSQFSISRYF